MPLTGNGLPYPVRVGVPPDVQKDIKDLADALDPYVGDTGWVALTVEAGWTAAYPVSWRRIGKAIHLRGEVFGGNTGSSNIIFTLPSGARPPTRVAPTIGRYHGSTGAAATLAVGTDGACYIIPIAGTMPPGSPGLVLNGSTWLID